MRSGESSTLVQLASKNSTGVGVLEVNTAQYVGALDVGLGEDVGVDVGPLRAVQSTQDGSEFL